MFRVIRKHRVYASFPTIAEVCSVIRRMKTGDVGEVRYEISGESGCYFVYRLHQVGAPFRTYDQAVAHINDRKTTYRGSTLFVEYVG